MYDYTVHAPNILNLYSYIKEEHSIAGEKITFEKFLLFIHKGDKYLVVTDN